MSEQTGKIVFINSHDYTSDITGEKWVGCLASLALDHGAEILLYTESLRLQQTLEMAYATSRRVTVSYSDSIAQPLLEREPIAQASVTRKGSSGMFIIKAIWTCE